MNSVLKAFHCLTLSTSECRTLSLTYLYRKDKLALPGNLHTENLSVFALLNVVFFTTLYTRHIPSHTHIYSFISV